MSTLSQSNMAGLLADRAEHVRAELAVKVAREIDTPGLSAQEVRVAEEIIRILANDIEARVRENLSRSLRNSSRLPYDVAIRLAHDIEHVALPILVDSTVLTPDDLVEIVRSGSAAKQEAIAGRSDLTESVADEIITVAHAAAVSTLMRNAAAPISESGYDKAIERFADNDEVKESIVRRETLPIAIAERLVSLVSDNLQTYLVEHHELPAHIAADIVLQTQDVTTINLSEGCSEAELEHLARTMHRNERLTPFLVLRALCMGDMAFFEVAMAVVADIPVANARLLIQDAGPYGLRSLFDQSRWPQQLFPAFRIAVDVALDAGLDAAARDPERYRVQVINRVLTKFEQLGEREHDFLLNKLIGVLTFVAKGSAYSLRTMPPQLALPAAGG